MSVYFRLCLAMFYVYVCLWLSMSIHRYRQWDRDRPPQQWQHGEVLVSRADTGGSVASPGAGAAPCRHHEELQHLPLCGRGDAQHTEGRLHIPHLTGMLEQRYVTDLEIYQPMENCTLQIGNVFSSHSQSNKQIELKLVNAVSPKIYILYLVVSVFYFDKTCKLMKKKQTEKRETQLVKSVVLVCVRSKIVIH